MDGSGAGHASPSSAAAPRTASWSAPSSSTERIRRRRRARSKIGDVDPRRLDGRPPSQAGRPAMGLEEAQRVALGGRAHAGGDAGGPQALGGERRAARRGRAGRRGSRSSRATSDSGRPARSSIAAVSAPRPRKGDSASATADTGACGHVQAAVGVGVVVPRGALVLAGEPQRPARGVARGRRVDRQHPPDDHAKLPAASASIASSSSRVFPPRMRSTGRRSRRCGLTPSSQSSAASGE